MADVNFDASITLLPSAARTAEATAKILTNKSGFTGLYVLIDVTLDPALAIITPTIEIYDQTSETWFVIGTGTAIAATGQFILRLSPHLVAAADIFQEHLGYVWRVGFAHTDTDSITYSAHAILVN